MLDLDPRPVWAHFSRLCEIPRSSRNEQALKDHLVKWAQSNGIESRIDSAGNLILKKPGLGSDGVILQGHLDMVCQANSGTSHDFLKDPIRAILRDGWLVAENTTLGADNGIGVALALSVLEDRSLVHPPLEVLLTVNEESGMDGARGLSPGTLEGKWLINLDTEEWGHFYLGCAGGIDVEISNEFPMEKMPQGHSILKIELSGLLGGHSGIDIHLGRGNAILLLSEFLSAMPVDFGLVEFSGGTARNAIPREAQALVCLPEDFADSIASFAAEWNERLKERFPLENPLLCAKKSGPDAKDCLPPLQGKRLLDFLLAAKNGVFAMSLDFPGVVETSDNLGILTLSHGRLFANFNVRSLRDEKAQILAEEIAASAKAQGLQAILAGSYPGWTPDPSSFLLELCRKTYLHEFGEEASLQVIHAGLECGLFASSHPLLEMISFGPDIRGAHAPGERVEIASVEKCWRLLNAVLKSLCP